MEAVSDFLVQYGYIGLFIGAFLAATIIPFSSDLLLIGVLAVGCNPYISVGVATLGNWLGSMTSYWLGRMGKWEWIEKYLRVKREKIERQRQLIEKWGSLVALLAWVPFIGDIMAIGLGFYRVDVKKTAVFIFIGKFARYVMWAAIFYWVKPLFC